MQQNGENKDVTGCDGHNDAVKHFSLKYYMEIDKRKIRFQYGILYHLATFGIKYIDYHTAFSCFTVNIHAFWNSLSVPGLRVLICTGAV